MRANRSELGCCSSWEIVGDAAENAARTSSTAKRVKANASKPDSDDFLSCGAGGPKVIGQMKTTNIASATNTAIVNWLCVVTRLIIGRYLYDGNKIRVWLLNPERRLAHQ
jgi:hypothetical protein